MSEKLVLVLSRPEDVEPDDFGDVLRFRIAPQLMKTVPGVTGVALTLHDGEAPAPVVETGGLADPAEAAIQVWADGESAAGVAVDSLRDVGSTVQGWRVRERCVFDAREPLPSNTRSPWIRFLPFMERLDDVTPEFFDTNYDAHGRNTRAGLEEFRAELGVGSDSALLMRRGLWRYMQNVVVEAVTVDTYWKIDGIGELDRIGRALRDATALFAKPTGGEEQAKEFARRAARPNRIVEQPYYKMSTRRVIRGHTYEYSPN
jgi:hypothetical protein